MNERSLGCHLLMVVLHALLQAFSIKTHYYGARYMRYAINK